MTDQGGQGLGNQHKGGEGPEPGRVGRCGLPASGQTGRRVGAGQDHASAQRRKPLLLEPGKGNAVGKSMSHPASCPCFLWGPTIQIQQAGEPVAVEVGFRLLPLGTEHVGEWI